MKFKDEINQKKIEIGLVIQERMKELNLTRQKLSKLSGLTPNQVGWICKGSRDMTLSSYLVVMMTLEIESI